MPIKIKSSYEALLFFVEDIDIVKTLCSHYLNEDSFFDFDQRDSVLWQILLNKINDNRHHHYTNTKSLEFLQYKLNYYTDKHALYNLLKYLYLEHFDLKRGRNILRTDRIESFQFLQNTIDITPIYAMSISEYSEEIFNSYEKKIDYINESLKDNNIPLPHRFLSVKQFSDNHFHLGGGNNYNYRLHKMLQNPLAVDTYTSPQNHRLTSLQNSKQRKFIIYATSILEQLLISYIVNNNTDLKTNQNILINRQFFRNSLRKFSKAIIENNFQLLDSLFNNIDTQNKNSDREEIAHLLFDIRPKLYQNFYDTLLTDNYYNELIYYIIRHNISNEIHKADIMLWILFSDIARDHKDDVLKDFILIYMMLRNILHSFIIQDQKEGGLEYFSSYSRSSLRRAKEDYELNDTFRSVFNKKYTFYIEGRIVFHDHDEQIAHEIAKWFKSFLESNLILGHTKNRLKFMIHYQKNIDQNSQKFIEDETKKFLPIRYEYYREKIFKETQVLLNFLNNPKYKRYKISLNIEYLYHSKFLEKFKENNYAIQEIDYPSKSIIVNLHHLVSGIDAASLEYNTPPEVFAPIYNYIKHSPELLNKSFQFSFHAGEDTEDITTSLRTIVETVIFLDLKKGDRLGHALSLGIQQQHKTLEEDTFLISQEKALDNAVFLYFLFYSLYGENDRYHYLNIFEQKILQLGPKIYGKSYTVDQYINAWLLRRNSPVLIDKFLDNLQEIKTIKKKSKKKFAKFLQKLTIFTYHEYKYLYPYKLFFKYGIQDVFKLKHKIDNFYTRKYESARSDVEAWKIFLKYHFSSSVRRKGAEQIEDNSYNPKIIEIAQDFIMEYVIAENDIIIEVMPTSNLLNSTISSYTEHPIFRFKPINNNLSNYNKFNIRKSPLKVIINTDNPGFQATSYLNELFLINEAAIKLGYNHNDIEAYINEIVELGNMIFSGIAPQE